MNLMEFKQQNPSYANVPDQQLADALHSKYYSSVPKDKFYSDIGLVTKSPDEHKGIKEASEKGQVYVKPIPGLSQAQTAELYSFAEGASSSLRGIAQLLGVDKKNIEEQVYTARGLEQSKEFGTKAKVAHVAGIIADPVLYTLPIGKAKSITEFVKDSAIAGGVMGFTSAKTEEESSGAEAVKGAAFGAVGGAVLGTVMKAGAKLFGKEWLPWKATPEEKKAIVKEVTSSSPEQAEQIAHFLDTTKSAHIEAKNKAEALIEKNASIEKIEKARKNNSLIGHYLDAYAERHTSLVEAFGKERGIESLFPKETSIAEKQAQFAKEQQALQQRGASTKLTDPTPSIDREDPYGLITSKKQQGGFISPQLAAQISGAGIGAILDPEDPLTGAVAGLAVAHGGWKALEKVYLRDFEKAVSEVPKDAFVEVRKLVGSTSNEIRARQRASFTTAHKVNELVPSEARRELVSHALETPSLESSLTKEEQEAVRTLRKGFDELGQRALAAKVIKELRLNYLTHIVDLGKDKSKSIEALNYFLGTGAGASGAGRVSSKFGKERVYETIKDLEAAGFKLKTKDAAQLFKIYADSVERAIAGKNLINSLSGKVLPGGKAAAVKLGANRSTPYGWTVNPTVPRYAFHPDIAPLIEHIFSSNSPGVFMRTATAITNAVKRVNVLGTFLHSWNLFGSMVLSAPTIAAKEAVTGFKGIRQATKAFREGGLGDSVDSAIKNGLVLETPMDVDKHIFGHIGSVVDALAQKGGFSLGAEKGGKVLEKYTTEITDKVTWDYMHTGGKLLVYQHLLDKAKIKNPEAIEGELEKEVAKFVNNAFGGLNWTQIASDSTKIIVHGLTNPRSRAVMALAEFAPDWTLSTVRAAMSSFIGKGTGVSGIVNPKTATDLSRQYMLRTAMAYLTLFEGINQITSGKHVWENKDPTRIEFKDGTSIQIAKHAMEPFEWALHPEKTLANKMAFLPRASLLYWGEKQYPFGPELEDKSASSKMKAISKMALPFQATSVMSAPEGQKLERAVLGTLGLPEYGMTPQQKIEARISRMKLRFEQRKRRLLEK